MTGKHQYTQAGGAGGEGECQQTKDQEYQTNTYTNNQLGNENLPPGREIVSKERFSEEAGLFFDVLDLSL